MNNIDVLNAIQSGGAKAKGRMNSWILLVVSLFLFAGAGVFRWEPQFIILIAITIFIHEVGHLIAMRLYKYKNLKMLFIPFLGGVAFGESEEQDAYKIAMISIFGPLVGFLSSMLAVIIWLFFREDILLDYAKLSLIINAFNLLPIVPLDGGHFLNETLFNRFPKAELVFKVFAMVGLASMAYGLGIWFFWIIVFFMFITLKVSYKMARAACVLRKDEAIAGGELTEAKIAKIREAIRQANPYFEDERHIQKLPGAVNGMWLKINKTFPDVRTTVFLLVAYAFISFGIPTFTMGFIQGATNGHLAQPISGSDADH